MSLTHAPAQKNGAEDDRTPSGGGDRQMFWADQRAKRRFTSKRGRRSAPTDTLLADAPGDPDHWVRVADTDVRGIGLYEYRPPAPPEPETAGQVHDAVTAGRVWNDSVVAGRVFDHATAGRVWDADPDAGKVHDAPEKTAEITEVPGEQPETTPDGPPLGSHGSSKVVSEAENSRVYQENGSFTVENTETGACVRLPDKEWHTHATYFKRGSHLGYY